MLAWERAVVLRNHDQNMHVRATIDDLRVFELQSTESKREYGTRLN